MGSLDNNIRHSTHDDFEKIHSWLKDQHCRGTDDSFFCNINVIQSCHEDEQLIVYVDDLSEPVAFLAYQASGSIDILEVKREQQKKGIGAKLVNFFIEEKARKNDEAVVEIECAPVD